MRALLPFLLLAAPYQVTVVAGGGTSPADGPALQVKLDEPFNAVELPSGELVLAEHAGGRVRKLTRDGRLVTIAGTGTSGFSGDGGPATAAQFYGIHSMALAPNGDLYLADTWNARVRKVDHRTGIVTTVVGSGPAGDRKPRYDGDGGPANRALCGPIYHVSLNPGGTALYLTDLHNRRIRRVELQTGVITTVAGNGLAGTPAEGAVATAAPLVDPRAAAPDAQGNLYLLERGGNCLRVVRADGTIHTVAGTGKAGGTGDGGPALEATLRGPKHLWCERDGNVLIADAENHVIRRYLPATGRIERVAGTGKPEAGLADDPLRLGLNRPHGVYVSPGGVMYIADSFNHRVVRIAPAP